jgi:hypothetical protein
MSCIYSSEVSITQSAGASAICGALVYIVSHVTLRVSGLVISLQFKSEVAFRVMK